MNNFFQKSFTLVEVLIYITIFSIIMTAVAAVTIWTVCSNARSEAIRETRWGAERAMGAIIHEIKEARSIYSPTTSLNQLSLVTEKYLPGGESSSYIDFYQCGNRLCLKKEGQDPIALTSEEITVTSLEFIVLKSGGSSSVMINLEVKYNTLSNRPEYNHSYGLKSTASLR